MMISTEKGSSQIVSAREDTRFYDDLACLRADWPAHSQDAAAFVRVDLAGATEWKDAMAAFYARPAGAQTPMGSGIVAFADAGAARAADREGRAYTWDELGGISGATR